jgi:hypothetical protein
VVTAEVNLPTAAFMAAAEVSAVDGDTIDAILAAAAPLIVVAELERLGVALCQRQQEMRADDDRSIRSSGLGEAITVLRDRVAELRGESR